MTSDSPHDAPNNTNALNPPSKLGTAPNQPSDIPPLGQILLKEDALTEDQLDRALRIQARLEQHRQLGDVLVELGYVTRQAISDAITKHGKSLRIGDMLVEQGLVSPEDLERCLMIHKAESKPIGQVLLEQGLISERTLLQNLAYQAQVPYIEPTFGMVDTELLEGIAPDFLERNRIMPFSASEDGIVTVIVIELHDEQAIRAIEDLYQNHYKLALALPDAMDRTFAEYRAFRTKKSSENKGHAEDTVVQLVNSIIQQAIEDRASDVHIEPMADRIRLRYRIDGILVYKTDLPKDMLPRLVSRIKILTELDIAESRRHQGGRIKHVVDGIEYDLRVSVYVSVHGESVVIRILNAQKGLLGLQELGMPPSMLERFREDVLDMPTGVVLITGPTGSGKTTTLYSALDYNNDADTKLITVEDPVEYLIDGLVQCSVFDKAGRTFERSLREIVRQDPDIIVLGEIRDRTTAEVAIQAALTGHKVYSTFHTEDTIGGLVRLLNMEIDAFLISSTVISVLAQRLLRRICTHCAAPHQPGPKDLRRLGLNANDVREFELQKGRGCRNCNFTGYFGRVAVYELLVLNEDVRDAVLAQKPAYVIRQISTDSCSLVTMREDGIAKVIHGFTTFDEVIKHTPVTARTRPLRQILTMTR